MKINTHKTLSSNCDKDGVKIFEENGATIIKFYGDIDHHSSEKMRNAIDKVIVDLHPSCLIFDYEMVKFMDSSGIGLIIGRYKNAKKIMCRIEIVNTSPRIKRLLELSGIERIVKL